MGSFCAFHESFFVKSSVCSALVHGSALLASPQGKAALQGSSVVQESQEAKMMHKPQEAPSPSSGWGISKVSCILMFRHPTVQRLCSTGSTKQKREKNVFGLLSAQHFCNTQGKHYPRQQSCLFLCVSI